jgi:hypothetical protein
VLPTENPLVDGQQRGQLVAGPPAALPACPVQRARLPRVPRVSERSGPRTCSRMGSSSANWSRAPAALPAYIRSRRRVHSEC